MSNFSSFLFKNEKQNNENNNNENENIDYISFVLKHRPFFSILISFILILGKYIIQNFKKSISIKQKRILGLIVLDYIIFKQKKKIFQFYSKLKIRIIEKDKKEKIQNFMKLNTSQINFVSNKLLLVINILKYKLLVEKSINAKEYLHYIHSLSEIIYSGKKDMIKIMKKISKKFMNDIYEWERKELEKIKIFKRKYLLKERNTFKTFKHFMDCLFQDVKP